MYTKHLINKNRPYSCYTNAYHCWVPAKQVIFWPSWGKRKELIIQGNGILSRLRLKWHKRLWTSGKIKGTQWHQYSKGAGTAQWLEHRTRDWKVAGSNPCWNGGRIFFSRVDFLCWLLFRYPFHPRVTTVARKKSRSFCQKCRWQVTAEHAYTLRMWILLNHASALVTTCP